MWIVHCFFNEPATTEIYTYGPTLSLLDALPISERPSQGGSRIPVGRQNDAEAEQGGDQHELAERDPGQPRHCYGEIAGPDDVGDGQREETAFQKLVGNGGSIRQRPQSQRRQRQAGGEELDRKSTRLNSSH